MRTSLLNPTLAQHVAHSSYPSLLGPHMQPSPSTPTAAHPVIQPTPSMQFTASGTLGSSVEHLAPSPGLQQAMPGLSQTMGSSAELVGSCSTSYGHPVGPPQLIHGPWPPEINPVPEDTRSLRASFDVISALQSIVQPGGGQVKIHPQHVNPGGSWPAMTSPSSEGASGSFAPPDPLGAQSVYTHKHAEDAILRKATGIPITTEDEKLKSPVSVNRTAPKKKKKNFSSRTQSSQAEHDKRNASETKTERKKTEPRNRMKVE